MPMAQAAANVQMAMTWENRVVLRLPRSIPFASFLICGALISAYLVFQWTFGLSVTRTPILVTLIIAYTMSVTRYLSRSIALDQERYGFEAPSASLLETEIRALQYPPDAIRRSRVAGGCGVALSIGIFEAIVLLRGYDFYEPWVKISDDTASIALIALLGWLLGRVSYISVAFSASSSDTPFLSSREVDLLNLDNLHGIGRSGLRVALVWIVGVSLFGLFFLDLGLWILLPLVSAGFVVGVAALVLPAREVQRLIREVKRSELARLAPQILAARDDTISDCSATQGRLADLLAYEARIASASEWPFDPSTLLRFGLYLLIPVISMVGGALVERAVDLVLD